MESVAEPLPVRFHYLGFCLLESAHQHDFQMEWTRHAFGKILLPLRGSGLLLTRTRNVPLQPGRPVYVPCDWEHRVADRKGDPLKLYILCLRQECAGAGPSDWPGEPLALVEPGAAARVAEAIRRLPVHPAEPTGAGVRWQCLEAIATILTHFCRPRQSIPNDSRERVRALSEREGTDFLQLQGIDHAARVTGLSRRRFTQLFREVTGRSFQEFTEQLRMRQASELLVQTRFAPLTVAFQCGYQDASTFYRAFRRRYGVAPLEYRNAFQKAG